MPKVWQSARAVLTRMLDGVEPGITEEIRHAAEHVPSVERVLDIKTRWLGHRLHADVAVAVPGDLSVTAAEGIASTLRRKLVTHLPALRTANITFGEPGGTVAADAGATPGGPGHPHADHPYRPAMSGIPAPGAPNPGAPSRPAVHDQIIDTGETIGFGPRPRPVARQVYEPGR